VIRQGATAYLQRNTGGTFSERSMIIPAPMLLAEHRTLSLDEPEWVDEGKLEGWRIMAGVDHGRVTLMTSKGADATSWFPEICAGLATLRDAGPHVLDGLACALDASGRRDSSRLQARVSRRRRHEDADPVVYCA
jgi:ATP-dependent DNA ligase